MKILKVGHLKVTSYRYVTFVDWRVPEHYKRWRFMLGRHPLWFPVGMPPRRTAHLLGLAYAWYPKGYEP